MSQTKIAYLLGVSQPAVKQYLDEDESLYYKRLLNLGLSKEELDDFLEKLTQLLLNGDSKQVMEYVSLTFLSNLSRLKFCKFHKIINTEIPNDCEICRNFYKENEEELIQLALSMLQNEAVGQLIPEVLSNLAFAKSDAKNIDDVIAIPGRITKIRNIPTPASKPMWGGSKHLARVLLNVMKNFPTIRSVMNIKYDEKVERVLKILNYSYKKVGPQDHADDEKIGNLVSSAYDSYVDVIVHLGGKGLEPNAYIFGKDPLDVAKKVINIGIKYTEIS